MTLVIDSGWEKKSVWSPGAQMNFLELRRITRDSAIQRAGRAGRTAPGRAVRCYSKVTFDNLIPHAEAEILSADLTGLLLAIGCWGSSCDALMWLDAPPEAAVAAGKKISLGHCNPSTDEIREAVERGADRVTHFANGASPLVHRFKNPFWEFLNNCNLKLGLICDGFHLPPETVSVALKIKEQEKCLPVSDASSYSGLRPGIYGNGKRQLEANGYLHVIGKDILAGSSCQQNTCVNFLMQKLGFSFPKAWRQCSLIPARSVGLTLPEIKVGDEASFVICREENKTAVIDRTVIMGTEYPFAQPASTKQSSALPLTCTV